MVYILYFNQGLSSGHCSSVEKLTETNHMTVQCVYLKLAVQDCFFLPFRLQLQHVFNEEILVVKLARAGNQFLLPQRL